MDLPGETFTNGYSIDRSGQVYGPKGPLKPFLTNRGYPAINVRGKTLRVHRLVAELFVPNPYGYVEVNHKDGNKTNNQATNLEWCSRGHNIAESYRLGLRNAKGVNNSRAILSEEQVRTIRNRLVQYEYGLTAEIAKEYNVSRNCISNIKLGKAWKETH